MPVRRAAFLFAFLCWVAGCESTPSGSHIVDVTGCRLTSVLTNVTEGASRSAQFKHLWRAASSDVGCPAPDESPTATSGLLVTETRDGPRYKFAVRELGWGLESVVWESTDPSLSTFRMTGRSLANGGDNRVHMFKRTDLDVKVQDAINAAVQRFRITSASVLPVTPPPQDQLARVDQIQQAARDTASARSDAEYQAYLRRKEREAEEQRAAPPVTAAPAASNPFPLLPPSFTEDLRRSTTPPRRSGGRRSTPDDSVTSSTPPGAAGGIASSRSPGSITSGGCHTTSAELGNRLPQFSAPLLIQARQAAVSEDLVKSMQAANAMGYTPQAAVKAALDQARSYDVSAKEALHAASEADALGNSEEDFLRKLNSGELDVSSCEGVRNGSLCGAVISKIGALTTRWIAGQMECHARNGTWPNSRPQ